MKKCLLKRWDSREKNKHLWNSAFHELGNGRVSPDNIRLSTGSWSTGIGYVYRSTGIHVRSSKPLPFVNTDHEHEWFASLYCSYFRARAPNRHITPQYKVPITLLIYHDHKVHTIPRAQTCQCMTIVVFGQSMTCAIVGCEIDNVLLPPPPH